MFNKFSWTEEYRKTWESDNETDHKDKTIQIYDFSRNRRNIIRHLLIAIDTSESIERQDYLPSIRYKVTNLLPEFIKNFTEANSLSPLSFMTVNSHVEEFNRHFDKKMLAKIGSKKFSLLNCLKGILKAFSDTKHSKECIIITGSIGSHDSESCIETIEALKKKKIKINIVSLSGEVTLFKRLCEATGGRLVVPYSTHSLNFIFDSFISPSESFEQKCTPIEVGFPAISNTSHLCLCHLEFSTKLYECPMCCALVCSIPRQCPVCDLNLISPLNLCKSYTFCYPLEKFEAVNEGACKACEMPGRHKCKNCQSIFCNECNKKLHEKLLFCPFCDQNNKYN